MTIQNIAALQRVLWILPQHVSGAHAGRHSQHVILQQEFVMSYFFLSSFRDCSFLVFGTLKLGRYLGAFVLSAAVFLFVDEGGDPPRGGGGGDGLRYGSSTGSLNRFPKSLN